MNRGNQSSYFVRLWSVFSLDLPNEDSFNILGKASVVGKATCGARWSIALNTCHKASGTACSRSVLQVAEDDPGVAPKTQKYDHR